MSVILDPSKQLIGLTLYYIEEQKPHGVSIFHIIDSLKEMEDWKSRGYRTEEEVAKSMNISQQAVSKRLKKEFIEIRKKMNINIKK